MPVVRYPIRYRPLPHGPHALARLYTECVALLDRATELDTAQQALAGELAHVRTQLAEHRLVMWPRIDRRAIVHGFRVTLRGGPAPIPPVVPNARPLSGKHLRSTALALLARSGRPMTLVEIHRELHLSGYAIASRQPVQRLANALGYEAGKGRAATRRARSLHPRRAESGRTAPDRADRRCGRTVDRSSSMVRVRAPRGRVRATALRRARGSPGAPAPPRPTRGSGSRRHPPTT